MTEQPDQPAPPPPPPGPEAAARLAAENDALAAQIANQALRREAGALAAGAGGRPGSVSVVKDAAGKIVVTTADGRTVTYDPAVGLDEDEVQHMIQSALEPPRPPDPPRPGPPESVMIVAVVLTFAFLIVLVTSVARVLGARAAARAAAPAASPDLAARLARIEQAVEAVAIEVERISESERYSARLLTERLPEPAPAGNGRGLAPAPGQGAPPGAPPTLDALR